MYLYEQNCALRKKEKKYVGYQHMSNFSSIDNDVNAKKNNIGASYKKRLFWKDFHN